MLLVSSHILDCGEIRLPDDVVIRVNLAWVNPLNLYDKLRDIPHDIYLDNPVGRVKPPNNKYSVENIISIIVEFNQKIKYLAISNVEHAEDLKLFDHMISSVSLVPKIETIKGIENIDHIIKAMPSAGYIMLDHDDLCSDLIRNNIDPDLMYTKYIDPLIEFCRVEGINLLRTQGIVFSTKGTPL
jgi:citrate lyase beta subunit